MPRKTLTKLIETGLSDPEIQKNKEFKLLLAESKKDLNNGYTPDLVSRKLSNGITKYLMHNNFKAPQAMLQLSNQLGKNDVFFQRNESSIIFNLKRFLRKFHKVKPKRKLNS